MLTSQLLEILNRHLEFLGIEGKSFIENQEEGADTDTFTLYFTVGEGVGSLCRIMIINFDAYVEIHSNSVNKTMLKLIFDIANNIQTLTNVALIFDSKDFNESCLTNCNSTLVVHRNMSEIFTFYVKTRSGYEKDLFVDRRMQGSAVQPKMCYFNSADNMFELIADVNIISKDRFRAVIKSYSEVSNIYNPAGRIIDIISRLTL